MKKLQKKLTILFYELSGAIFLLIFSLTFLSVKLYPGVILLAKNLFGATRVVCNCTSFYRKRVQKKQAFHAKKHIFWKAHCANSKKQSNPLWIK